MSAQEDLFALYEEWRLWTEAEGAAIQRAEWQRVHQCQNVKEQLQQKITAVTERVSGRPLEGGNSPSLNQSLRSILAGLIELEHRNNAWLAVQRRQAEAERDNLGKSSRHLRQIHHAYAPAGLAAWQSYS